MDSSVVLKSLAELEQKPFVGIKFGDADFYKAGIALFLLGFASFSLIYCVQPLLPEFTKSFSISSATSALSLSLTTAFLAFSIVLSGAFSQSIGRKGLMLFSLAAAAFFNFICAISPNWSIFLIARAIEGFVLGGVPAVAMAWIAEEIYPKHLSKTMGLYIAGTAFGGMMGRVGMGLFTGFFSWRIALGVLAILGLICNLGFYYLLPKSRNFKAQKGIQLKMHLSAWKMHLSNPQLVVIYSIGFLITSIFVCSFNYLTFRLSDSPYSLDQTQISLIFLAYSFGIISSTFAGYMAERLGKNLVNYFGFLFLALGIITTLASQLYLIIIGVGFITTGFFIVHSMASSAIGLNAKEYKGHATSLYLLFYYLGSSIVGSLGGWFWDYAGWTAVSILTLCLCLCAVIIVFLSQKYLHH